MNDLIRIASNLIIFGLILIIMGGAISSYIEKHYGYSYITMQDERGISGKCFIGKDGLYCKVKGGLVEVKQYGKR